MKFIAHTDVLSQADVNMTGQTFGGSPSGATSPSIINPQVAVRVIQKESIDSRNVKPKMRVSSRENQQAPSALYRLDGADSTGTNPSSVMPIQLTSSMKKQPPPVVGNHKIQRTQLTEEDEVNADLDMVGVKSSLARVSLAVIRPDEMP